MPTMKQTVLGFALAASVLTLGHAFAHRAPSSEEQSRIESVLRTAGYTSWGNIEFDDGLWEVDAYAYGRKYELKLSPDTFAIIRHKPDSKSFAGHVPAAEDQSRIEAALRNEGFARWGKIELDDGLWEVDAYASDGQKFELKLDRDTFAVVKRKLD